MKGNDYRDQSTCLYCEHFEDSRSYNDCIEHAECWCMKGMSDHEKKLASADMHVREVIARRVGRSADRLKDEARSLRDLHQVHLSGVCEHYKEATD